MLRKVLLHYKGTVLFYILNGIAEILVASLSVVYFQRLIDNIPSVRSLNEVSGLLIAYGALMVTNILLSYIDEYPMRLLMNGIYHKFKLMALDKVARINYLSYQDLGTGQLIKLIENGSDAGKKILFDFFIYIFRNIVPGIAISLIFIGTYSLEVMLAIALGYLFVFAITNLLLKYLYRIKNSILVNEESLSRYSVRGFMELIVFRLNKRYKREIAKLSDIANSIVKSRAKERMIHELFFALFALIVITVKLAIMYVGILQVTKGQSTIGAIVALVTFTDRVFVPIAIFNVKFVDYKLDRVAYDRFMNFMNLPDDINLQDGDNIELAKGSIEFENVGFSYRNQEIIRNLSFRVDPGSSVAIVGKSGAGKTTILKIILGLLKYTEGKVLIDGQELNRTKLNAYYDYVSYVSQDAPVFDGTLRENIVFDSDVSDDTIYAILERVELVDFVSKLPQGLDTQVGEKGLKLSGGEKQRLAFARVFFQKSRIVILDEPTSALDSITEEKIMNGVLEMLKNRTVVIIAHRLQTVREVDEILVLDDGGIVQRGKFNSLVAEKGLFRELWVKQSSNCGD